MAKGLSLVPAYDALSVVIAHTVADNSVSNGVSTRNLPQYASGYLEGRMFSSTLPGCYLILGISILGDVCLPPELQHGWLLSFLGGESPNSPLEARKCGYT